MGGTGCELKWTSDDLVPSHSLGGPPAAGRQRVFVGVSGGVDACSLDNVWSHLPYTSTGLLRQQRHITIRKVSECT